MTLYIGSTPLSKAYIGSTELQKIYVGSTEVWSNFSASGMTKNASAQSVAVNTFVQVVGMVAESGSSVSSDALVPNGSKVGATVSGQISISATNFMPSMTAEIRKNGVLVPGATVTAPTYSQNTATLTIPSQNVNVASGDLFTLWLKPAYNVGATIAAGVNTYLRIA